MLQDTDKTIWQRHTHIKTIHERSIAFDFYVPLVLVNIICLCNDSLKQLEILKEN